MIVLEDGSRTLRQDRVEMMLVNHTFRCLKAAEARLQSDFSDASGRAQAELWTHFSMNP